MFRETTTDYENSWHRAPCRQYVISLAGGISITASDGETRHIGAGVIVLVEDTTGKGLRTVDGLLPKSFGQRRAGSDLARNRKFESISLQRRVQCEPDFLGCDGFPSDLPPSHG
jgi:hypothetical protein